MSLKVRKCIELKKYIHAKSICLLLRTLTDYMYTASCYNYCLSLAAILNKYRSKNLKLSKFFMAFRNRKIDNNLSNEETVKFYQ